MYEKFIAMIANIPLTSQKLKFAFRPIPKSTRSQSNHVVI